MASKDEQQRYEEGQKKVAAAEKKVKDLLQTEKDKLIAAKVEELPLYFVAAWKLEAKRLMQPDFSANLEAKIDKVDSACLERMTRFLNRKSQAISALAGWQRHLPKSGSPPNRRKTFSRQLANLPTPLKCP